MAKKSAKAQFKAWNLKHYERLAKYNTRIEKLLNQAIANATDLVSRRGIEASDKPFSFSDDRQLKAEADKIMQELSKEITSLTQQAEGMEWKQAYEQSVSYIGELYKVALQSKYLQDQYAERLLGMKARNLDALGAFQKRKIGGMNLSGRIWDYTESFQQQMEVAIDTALLEGKSAHKLALSVQELLKNPDALFRRVRDENDELRMSKAMAAYHPGQGRYRSAYKNAMRLARSEINMAYRASDSQTAQDFDACVGIRVNLSNNHTCNGKPFVDICDELEGDYPKSFIFRGWHPMCRCFITYILKTDDEFWDDIMSGENNESVNTVHDVPNQFKEWVGKNEERIAKAEERGTLPYFLRDNKVYLDNTQEQELNIINKADDYLHELKNTKPYKEDSYTFDEDFFALLDKSKPIRVWADDDDFGSGASKDGTYIIFSDNFRCTNSQYFKHCIVYHEYGHCIYAQRELWNDNTLIELIEKQAEIIRKEGEYKIKLWGLDNKTGKFITYESAKTETISFGQYISNELENIKHQVYFLDDESFAKTVYGKKGLSKMDVIEQICSASDALMSITPEFGNGHTEEYFKIIRNRQTEYIAHAFENTFLGNDVFKKVMPSIYEEMIAYIKTLKPF